MLRSLIIVAVIILLSSCKGKNEMYFEVNGTIKNSPARMVYLEEMPIGGKQRNIVDSAEVDKNGAFKLTAKSTEESAYGLNIGINFLPIVFNDAKEVRINIDLQNREQLYSVNGSPASEQLKDFFYRTWSKLQSIYNFNRQLDSMYKNNVHDSVRSFHLATRGGLEIELKRDARQVIENAKSPALGMYVLGYIQALEAQPALMVEGFEKQEVREFVLALNEKFPDHEGLALVKNEVVTPEKAPDFTLPDPSGNQVSLSSFKGKYVLVDFWASWCQPCRRENPNVVRVYNKYKDKNFTILGVSLDADKTEWETAIQKDSLAWTHVSDLRQWESMVIPLFKFNSIPYNVLLDPEGNIIADGLTGFKLEAKLEEILK